MMSKSLNFKKIKLQNVFVYKIVKCTSPSSLQLRWLHWLRWECKRVYCQCKKTIKPLSPNLPFTFTLPNCVSGVILGWYALGNILHGNVGKCWATNRQKFCQLCDIWCSSDKTCLSKTPKLPYSIKKSVRQTPVCPKAWPSNAGNKLKSIFNFPPFNDLTHKKILLFFRFVKLWCFSSITCIHNAHSIWLPGPG